MNTTFKQAILNNYNIIAFLFVPIVSFFSWALTCDIFNILEFSKIMEEYRGIPAWEYIRNVTGFFSYAVWGFSFMQILIPLLSSFITLPFLREKRMFNFSYAREESYKKAVLKPMLRQLIIGCTVLFLGYMVFLTAGLIWGINPESAGGRVFMPEIFGSDFVHDNMFMFFVVDGFWKYFVFCFVYGLFSICISFYTKKDFLCLIIPTVYYLVFNIILSGIGEIKLFGGMTIDLALFAPSYPIMSGARNWVSIPQVIIPLLPPLIFSLFTLYREFAVKQNRKDVYAV